METVAEILEEFKRYAGASGRCDDQTAIEYLNKARRLLWNKTDFSATLEYACLSCIGSCITLPSAYKQVRLAWVGGNPVSLGDEWYVSIPDVGLNPNHSCHSKLINIGGYHVTFRDYTPNPYQIALQVESPQDAGTQVTVFATDQYGTKKKEEITLQSGEYAFSAGLYINILSVIKPRTVGRIRVYAYDKFLNQRLLLAIYQPYDINPHFLKYQLRGVHCSNILTIQAKKKFYKLADMNEFVEFPTEALIWAAQAVVSQEQKNQESFTTNLALAVAEVNRESADQVPYCGSPIKDLRPNDNISLVPGFCRPFDSSSPYRL